MLKNSKIQLMKRHLLLSIFTLFFLNFASTAQTHVNYDLDTKWNFGINTGASWQERTTPYYNKAGYTIGMTLGRSIYEREGRALALGLRGRLQVGSTKGFNTTLSHDSTLFANHNGGVGYKNFRFGYGEGTLELVLSAQRLRERTGILLYAFGGVGVTGYTIRSDYKKGTNEYDYTKVDSTATPKAIVHELNNKYQDYDWETTIQGAGTPKTVFMPSLGMGLGYQITPRFSMGLEHKITFALANDINATPNSTNDRYHYTALTFRWNIFKRETVTPTINSYAPEERPIPNGTTPSSSGGNVGNYSTSSSQSGTSPTVVHKPKVNIVHPLIGNKVVYLPNYKLKANVLYVNSENDIEVTHNGVQVSTFTYNPMTKMVSANLLLAPGTNTFMVKGTNASGSDNDIKTIRYECNTKPVVTVIQPQSTQTMQEYVQLTVEIQNINSVHQLSVRHNGVLLSSSQLTYQTLSKRLETTVHLTQGINTIIIHAENDCGTKEKVFSIEYKGGQMPSLPPVVHFVNPPSSPYTVTGQNTFNISATVSNVVNAGQIQYKVNGVASTSFSFDPTTHILTSSIPLVIGNNTVEIKATNSAGSDTKVSVILKKVQEQGVPPIVTISVPNANPFTATQPIQIVNAKVLNVNTKGQIQVLINGVSTNAFVFDALTKKVSLNVPLNAGMNVVSITGTNTAGTETKTTRIVYNKVIVSNPPPEVKFTVPNTNPFITENINQTITATVSNISSPNQISVFVNGVTFSGFSFNAQSHILVFNIPLVVGDNTVEVRASNSFGSDAKLTVIKRVPPCTPPTVSYSIPSSSPHKHAGRNGNMAFTFDVGGVTQKSQVSVTNNGYTVPFNLDRENHTIWGTVPLQKGTNKMIVKANNKCGHADLVLDVLYEGNIGKLVPPEIIIDSPADFPYETSASNVMVTGKVYNVSHQNRITVTMDGQNIPFTYSTATKLLTIPTVLSLGSHQVRIRAINNYGIDTEVFDLVRKGSSAKPEVMFTNIGTNNSSRNPYRATQRSFGLRGKVLYFQGATVKVYVNGVKTSNYTYNSSTGEFSVPVEFPLQDAGTQRRITVEVHAENNIGTGINKAYLVYLIQSINANNNNNNGSNNSTHERERTRQKNEPTPTRTSTPGHQTQHTTKPHYSSAKPKPTKKEIKPKETTREVKEEVKKEVKEIKKEVKQTKQTINTTTKPAGKWTTKKP